MEFLVINSNKLKVMMTSDDMTKFGIDKESDEYDKTKNRKAFWRVLDVARDECGFSALGDKLLIQFYPCGDGCELFVTKLGKLCTENEKSIISSHEVDMISSRKSIYRFNRLSTMLDVIKRLDKSALKTNADLFYAEDENFYLIIEEKVGALELNEFSVILEYAEQIPFTLDVYIKEHSFAIFENGEALAALSSLI